MRHEGDSSPAVLRRTVVHVATSLSSRGSNSLPVQELVWRRIPRYRNPKQRSRGTHAPHASTTVTYRILVLPLCLNLNESKLCRTGDTFTFFCIRLLTLAFGHCVKPAQFSPENVCGRTWQDRLHLGTGV